MQLVVNGKNEERDAATVAALLSLRGNDPAKVVVELNEVIVPREDYAATGLTAGDRLEIVQFVGGG